MNTFIFMYKIMFSLLENMPVKFSFGLTSIIFLLHLFWPDRSSWRYFWAPKSTSSFPFSFTAPSRSCVSSLPWYGSDQSNATFLPSSWYWSSQDSATNSVLRPKKFSYSISLLGLFSPGVQRQCAAPWPPCCSKNLCTMEEGSQCYRCVYVWHQTLP